VPWGIQLSLGNYAAGMAIIWGILGPICGLFFLTKRHAVRLFIIFIINSVIANCLNPQLTEDNQLASEDFVSTFYAMNIGLPSMVIFGALWYTFARLSHQRGKVSMLLKETETKNRNLLDSITYAEYLQSAILPAFTIFKNKYPDSFLFLKPKDIVSGDFFWTAELEGRSYFAVCDCTGHGVPGSLVSIICNNALVTALENLRYSEPGIILDKTKELVVAAFAQSDFQVKDGMDIGLCCIDGDMLLFSGAKHSLYVFRSSEKEISEIKGSRQSIGHTLQQKQFTTHMVKLRCGDRIYMTTDGFLDQFGGPDNKKFRAKKFKQLLLESSYLSMPDQEKALEDAMHQWMKDRDQLDDMCVLGLQFDLN
jgi:serine phosphatase RsbU (regulator of sigma subunit)